MYKRFPFFLFVLSLFIFMPVAGDFHVLADDSQEEELHEEEEEEEEDDDSCDDDEDDHRRDCNHQRYSVRAYDTLAFGRIVPPDHGIGIVRIDAQTGGKTLEGGVFDLGQQHGAAVFEITARPGAQFEIVVPTSIRMRPRKRGVEIRDISVWPTGILRINPTGRQEFRIGGGMYLPSGTKPGNFRARFSVFVNRIME